MEQGRLAQIIKVLQERGVKTLKKSSRFIIDDRSPGDIGADGELLSYFCSIFAVR